MTTVTKERPILFNGEMVRAIRREVDPKWQTRRVISPQPECYRGTQAWNLDIPLMKWGKRPDIHTIESHGRDFLPQYCPYGQPGDRLWGRETWALVPRTAYLGSEGVQQTLRPGDDHDAAVYRAGWIQSEPGRWRPSIHMPRWASRITLEITGIRVERVQEISEEDAEAEGIECFDPESDGSVCRVPGLTDWDYYCARDAYKDLWDSINKARGYDWDSNPWVWCLSFKRID